uniref:Antigen 5 like allergen Cul n 1 n=1 Tax=Culicoides nubeculosus TaxID=144565 RepID=AG5L1_CULNU|nr:RecName: Full=Antigen 5 like allergen Cul n 1; Short=Ag5 like allergen Cul n 1; AltName: Full=Allergen Culn1; AltName: Full=Antigen 5 family protein; AltName: Full=Cul n 12; Flags: Precursor [Culicoides nubeculosus]ACM40888.1 antigen 5-related salivary protein [Culicoides nubeculosus]
MIKKLSIVILFSCISFVLSTNFCNKELCKRQNGPQSFTYLKHIGCRHTGKNANTCPRDAKILPMSTKRKNLILKVHNRLRNKVALGKLPGFPKAARMPILRWDDELAYLAELNVKQCKMEHDQCRNTDKFKYAGQNLAYTMGTPQKNAVRIKKLIRAWFKEHENATASFIDKYRDHPQGRVIGHFTAMIQDRTDTVGCAILRHSGNKYFFWPVIMVLQI